MGYREFEEWQAYIARHPPASEIIDGHCANMLSMLHAMFKAAGTAATTPAQWSILEQRRPKTAEELAAEESLRVKRMFGVM